MNDNNHLWYLLVKSLATFALCTVFAALGILVYIPMHKSINLSISKAMKPVSEAAVFASVQGPPATLSPAIVDGVHLETGMPVDANFDLVRKVCTACHSAKLITQNRATREGWKDMITWMQRTQGLPDLGSSEAVILDYLETHFAPKEEGRRRPLSSQEMEWYDL